MAGCDGGGDANASEDATKAADIAAAEGDAGSTSNVDQGPAVVSDDLPIIKRMLRVRASAAKAAKSSWPADKTAVWPAFSLHKARTLLVILNTKSMPRRAYLIGAKTAPEGARAAEVDGEALYRYDAGTAGMGPGETVIPDMEVAGESSLVVTWSPFRDTDELAWVSLLGELYMTRLREVETVWSQVQACGQTFYPRFEQALALVQLECAVMSEALDAKDAKEAEARLAEWSAIRASAIEVTNLVGLRARHYDNLFGSVQFVAGRLTVATGLRTAAEWKAALKKRLALPISVPVAEFDNLMLDSGDISAAAIEVATRAGWDVEPAFRAGHNVHTMTLKKFGEPKKALIEDAKARHDWSGYLKRAKAIMALPMGGGA